MVYFCGVARSGKLFNITSIEDVFGYMTNSAMKALGVAVAGGMVERAEDWIYGNQLNYSGLESLIEIDLADF